MRMTGWIVLFVLAALVAAAAWVRLAPVDPARWHVDLGAGTLPAHAQVFCIRPDTPSGQIEGDPKALMSRLDAIALATPRTSRLAGSAEEGRITWITRSRLFGFPDYTTAQVMPGPALCMAGRQGIGDYDWGVNAARVGAWAQALLGLPEPPAMTGF